MHGLLSVCEYRIENTRKNGNRYRKFTVPLLHSLTICYCETFYIKKKNKIMLQNQKPMTMKYAICAAVITHLLIEKTVK